jgi:hypothetical protein
MLARRLFLSSRSGPRLFALIAPEMRETHLSGCARCAMVAAHALIPKFVTHGGTIDTKLRNRKSTSKPMIPVPLFDLTFFNELAASVVGISNRRH